MFENMPECAVFSSVFIYLMLCHISRLPFFHYYDDTVLMYESQRK